MGWRESTRLSVAITAFHGVFSSDTDDETVFVPDPLVTATTQVAWDAVTEGQILKPDEPPIIWNDVTVRNGDNLSLIFNRAGFSDRDVYEVTSSVKGRALRKIFPGQLIGFAANEDNALIAVRHIESPLKQTVYSKSEGQFVSEIITRETQTRERSVALTIDSSLSSRAIEPDYQTASLWSWPPFWAAS